MVHYSVRKRIRLLVNILGIGLVLLLVGVAHAQDRLDAPGFDVVFIVDQSGSMGGIKAGSKEHPRTNDTLDLRFEAPQNFVYLLGEDIIQVHKNASYRIALVDFGTTAQRRMDWTRLDDQNYEQLDTTYKGLTDPNGGLNAGKLETSNLGNTNFIDAFEEAAKLFDELPSDEPNRVRVVILLTDGAPCVWLQDANTCADRQKHMDTVAQIVQDNLAGANTRLYVVAMNDADPYWKEFGPRWTAITGEGRARQVQSNADVGKFFQDILIELRGLLPGDGTIRNEAVRPGGVVVPPYLDSIAFTLFKRTPEEELQVQDAQGRRLTPDMENVSESGRNIYRIKVFQPEPGRWTLVAPNSDPENVSISMQQVVARGQLLSPTGAEVQFAPVTIEWQLLDSRGQPLPKYTDPRYQLTPNVTIRSEHGALPSVDLALKDDSIYAATFTPVDQGPHSIEMRAASLDADGKPVEVFSGTVKSFDVSPVILKPVGLSPTHAQFVPLKLEYALQTASGAPIPGVAAGMTVSATVQTGGHSLPLTLRPSTDGHFTGEFVPVATGSYQVVASTKLADPDGQMHTIDQGVVGKFTVARTRLQAIDPPQSAPIFTTQHLRYEFVDAANNPVKVADNLVIEAQVNEGGVTQPLTLNRTAEGQLQGDFIPTVAGRCEVVVTLTSVGATGATVKSEPEPVSNFDTQLPTIKPTSPGSTSSQFKPMEITYEVRDSQGRQWQLAPGYQLTFTTTVSLAGAVLKTVALASNSDTTYSATFTPDRVGMHQILVTANINGPDGLIPLYSSKPALEVAVTKTTRIGLHLTQPAAGSAVRQDIDQLAWRFDGLPIVGWFSEPAPVAIQVELVDEGGAIIDPNGALEPSKNVPVVATVTKADRSADVSNRFTLLSAAPGIYRATALGLPVSDYTVVAQVAPSVVPRSAYDFNTTQRSATGTIKLALNPWVIGARAGFALLLITLVFGSAFTVVRRRALSVHPVKGTLMIVDERGVPLHTRVLSGRNYLKLTGFPATTRIKWMEVTCRNDNDSRAGIVNVKGRLDDGSAFGGQMSPSSGRLPLGKYKIYLTKPQ